MTTRPTYAADALGIGIATGVYGISFGVLAVAAGLTEAQACAMSLLVFTGGSQFAAVGVLAAGGAAATAVANAMLLAVRNMAYGLSLSSLLRGALPRRAVAAQLVIDETTAMARAQDDERGARSGSPAARCSCAGTRGRWRARWPAPASATRRSLGSTRCSRPRSSPCSHPSCASPARPPRRW